MSKTRLGDGQRQSTQPNYNTAASTSVRTELALTGSFALRPDQLVNGRTNVVPAFPARRSGAPMAARFPVASTKRQAASTFGPIEPVGISRDH